MPLERRGRWTDDGGDVRFDNCDTRNNGGASAEWHACTSVGSVRLRVHQFRECSVERNRRRPSHPKMIVAIAKKMLTTRNTGCHMRRYMMSS